MKHNNNYLKMYKNRRTLEDRVDNHHKLNQQFQ